MLGPVTQAIYPRICALGASSLNEARALIRKVAWGLGGSLLLYLLLFATAEQLVRFVLGTSYMESLSIVKILAFIPFMVVLRNIFAVQIMLNFGLEKQFSKIFGWSGLVSLALVTSFAYFRGAKGATVAVLATEIIVTSAMGVVLKKQGILDLIRKTT
jgi:PST family polysaccharide transporter